MDEELAEIAQISFYLGRENQNFDSILDSEGPHASQPDCLVYDFDVEGVKCRFIYFETVSKRSNPPWLDFANEQLPDDKRIQFSDTTKSANGLILILLEGRVFLATFGRSAASCLASQATEPDFGIKVAMNMCGNEEVRQTRSQSNTITPTQIDRQANKPSDSFTFGLSEAEDLKFISAHMKGDPNVTLQGRDNLTIKVIGTNKLTWSNLIDRCKGFLKHFRSKAYTKLFPNYKNFQAASESEADALDALLVEALKKKAFDRVRLSIPEFISEEDYRYTYSNYDKRDNHIYAFLDSRQMLDVFSLDKVTVDQLKAKRIYAYSALEDRILSNRKWRVYDCLSFEHKLGKKYFILSDGRWLEVDSDFYKSILSFINNTLRIEACETALLGIDMSDHKAKQNKESIFNTEVCVRLEKSILFDRAKLRIGLGKKDKEFCDVLDMQDDGRVRIINCKPYKDASSINYLFSQSQFYCEAFLQDDGFLAEIREHISKSKNPAKGQFLSYIASNTEDLNGRDYRLCLWLLCNQAEALPSKNDIPLIAQYELKLMHDHLRKVCKLHEVVLRFIPVKVTNYKTAFKKAT